MNRWMVFIVYSAKCFFDSGFMKSNGVILDQMVAYLDTTHSLVAWTFSIQFGMSLMSAPLANILLKVLNYRQIATIGGSLAGLGYVCGGLCVQSVWQMFLSFLVSGIGFGFMELPLYLALHESFQEKFGMAFCASSLFNFVGIAVLPPIMQTFTDWFGFRNALLLFGAIAWNMVPCGISLRSPVVSKLGKKECDEIEGYEKAAVMLEETTGSLSIPSSDKSGGRWKSVVQKYLYFCFDLIHHTNFTIVAVVEFVVFYTYVSWAVFLVSLGTSSGFTLKDSVLLSTTGGVGGFFGKVMAILLFHSEKMNAYSCGLIPLIISGVSFAVSIVVKTFYGLALCAFLSGASLGHVTSGLVALIPNLVCKRHVQQAVALVCLLDGTAVQLGGLLSGMVRDAFGSTCYVFGLNACLCFISLPLVFVWACSNQTVKECEKV